MTKTRFIRYENSMVVNSGRGHSNFRGRGVMVQRVAVPSCSSRTSLFWLTNFLLAITARLRL